MGISKYPRPGQRIAPETLREILDVPVPADLRDQVPASYETLAHFDEMVWQHVPAATCRVLAERVLRQVHGGLARSLGTMKSKPLPRFHQPTPVSALEVEVRTCNCLDNCLGLRVGGNLQFLNDLTVGDLLAWRNLGAHSLVDLLVALESAAAKSRRFQDRQQRAENAVNLSAISPTELPSEFRVAISHFPRMGDRIAPRTLSHILNVPARSPLGDVILQDLDESAWERFESKTCHELVLEVVKEVRRFRGILCGQLGNRQLPIPQTNGRPALLCLQAQTFHRLSKAGLLEDPARFAETTFRELFEIPGFGNTCLVDLLCALETQVAIAHRNKPARVWHCPSAGKNPRSRIVGTRDDIAVDGKVNHGDMIQEESKR
jgi:hypothetical protein